MKLELILDWLNKNALLLFISFYTIVFFLVGIDADNRIDRLQCAYTLSAREIEWVAPDCPYNSKNCIKIDENDSGKDTIEFIENYCGIEKRDSWFG